MKMSDKIEDLVKTYEENVFNVEHPRKIGLFPIPEYPELEGHGMWSEALNVLLTTLRYLAPATLLTLFWGQQSFLFRLLKSIDNAFRASRVLVSTFGIRSVSLSALQTIIGYLAPTKILALFWREHSLVSRLFKGIEYVFRGIAFSSEEQKQSVLQWLAEAGPVRVEQMDTVWKHGWILCGVLDAALPGACAGHPPTRLSLKHAQAIADHYLGVEPVFTRQELESNDSLSRHQEWKLATYLARIREALSKITTPVSKPPSQRKSPDTTQFTMDYVAKGSGLTVAQVKNKMHLKIYPTPQQSLDPGAINVLIKGPKDTYGMAVLPPVLGKAQMIRQKLLGLEHKHNFTENALPITQGTTYLRNYGKNDMNKTYYIPKTKYDIDIEVDVQEEFIKIGYVVPHEGKHEISITSRGQHIIGSPFTVQSSNDIIHILENDNFYLEDGEELDIMNDKRNKKVVLRIVDFVTEKMLLKENGILEQISEDEAKRLMLTDKMRSEKPVVADDNQYSTTKTVDIKTQCITFKRAADKIVQMNRVCKIIRDYNMKAKESSQNIEKHYKRQKSEQKIIPDIVNSTFSDLNQNPFIASDKRDKVIVPENISVNLKTIKSKSIDEEEQFATNIYHPLSTPGDSNSPDSLEKYEKLEQQIEEEILDRPISASNPFLNDISEQNFALEKDLGSYVKIEYETNNCQSEDIPDAPIKIVVKEDDTNTPSPLNTNPFFEPNPDIINMERPKTPVLKIISGEINDDSVYVDPKTALIPEDMLPNEFLNPFFLHLHDQSQKESVTDFIIGAPVSLPPVLRARTPEPIMQSLFITENNKSQSSVNATKHQKTEENSDDVFLTPVHTSKRENSTVSSTFHSLESNISDQIDIVFSNNDRPQPDPIENFQKDRDVTPKKDMWDSAYVSIDDSNSSPDSNNNDNGSLTDTPIKPKFSLSDNSYMISNMGPAERELWQSCNDLKQDIPKVIEEVKPSKWDNKRFMFTPIIEESDRSISSGPKEIQNHSKCIPNQSEIDSVTLAFSEIDNMYQDSPSLCNSTPMTEKTLTNEMDLIPASKNDVKSVDSASDIPDVKRHAEITEGKISEVQANVTESVSVSQTLQKNQYHYSQPLARSHTTVVNDSPFNIVKKRKQYWDEKIREIEAISEENKTQQRRRRLSSKCLRHNDSLTKRKGKQIVKNFIAVAENQSVDTKQPENREIINAKSPLPEMYPKAPKSEIKLVDKWKKYWDCKLETEKEEKDSICSVRTNSPNPKESFKFNQNSFDDLTETMDNIDRVDKSSSQPVKQELAEEVFKAFETSPKRFFGTSRKQILNKIDTFLGKPSTIDETLTVTSYTSPDTGLVSSRISLFHNITNTEELPWTRRKCQSLQNIFQRKDSDKNSISVDESLISELKDTPNVNNVHYKKGSIDTQELNYSFDESKNSSLKERRARMAQNIHNKTFDESFTKTSLTSLSIQPPPMCVQNVIEHYSKSTQPNKYTSYILRKSSMSKSEMDIFNKTTNTCDDDLDKYKSFDELPKINVKNFISLYESVSKPDVTLKSSLAKCRSKPNVSSLHKKSETSSITGTANNQLYNANKIKVSATKSRTKSESHVETDILRNVQASPLTNYSTSTEISFEIVKENKVDEKCSPSSARRNNLVEKSFDSETSVTSPHDLDKETTYLSLSDIELEIVESAERSEASPKIDVQSAATDYKSRFKMAKQYFQSLEELREIKKPRNLNECELLLEKKSPESLEKERPRPQKRVKKNIKAHSVPSSEISKIWNQLQGYQNDNNKLVKISEKFNVEDLFTDVTEGRLSRQGSLRGIPHKKAVLETFRSMENLSDKNLSPYEIAVSQLNEFAKENKIKNAQTYLTEYPYLPTTDPSKYQSRVDTRASGLISLKELIYQKPRRNSVPDLRLNAEFTDNV